MEEDSGHKSEESKCLYPILTLQDGRPTPYPGYFTGERFHVQNRSE